MSADVIYSNAPLVEAVFEIRFAAEPAIECHRDKFYDLIRSEYTDIHVPIVKGGEAPALGYYRFDRKDGSASVMLAINRFSFVARKYEGFRKFKKEALRVMTMFAKLFKIKKLKRTGLRYVNAIKFVRDGNIIPISNYLNLELRLPQIFANQFRHLEISFLGETSGGLVQTRIHPVMSDGVSDKSQEAIVLDFDFSKEGDLHFRDIALYVEQSHRATKEMFESVITEDYRRYLMGEKI